MKKLSVLPIVSEDPFDIELFTKWCWDGDLESAQRFLKTASVDQLNSHNARTQTPLYCASRNGHEEIVKELLKINGLDVDVQDAKGHTALHAASWEARTRVISILLSFGCDLTLKSSDRKTAREEANGAAYEVWKVFEEAGVVGLVDNNYPIWSRRHNPTLIPYWYNKKEKEKEWKPFSEDESNQIELLWRQEKYGGNKNNTKKKKKK